MQRQFIHIILSLLLVASTTGLTLNKHFCGDMLQSVSLQKVAGCCGEKPSEKESKKGCCENQTQEIKADTDFQAGFSLELTHPVALIPTIQFYSTAYTHLPSLQEVVAFTDSGPPLLPLSQYLSIIQQFRL